MYKILIQAEIDGGHLDDVDHTYFIDFRGGSYLTVSPYYNKGCLSAVQDIIRDHPEMVDEKLSISIDVYIDMGIIPYDTDFSFEDYNMDDPPTLKIVHIVDLNPI